MISFINQPNILSSKSFFDAVSRHKIEGDFAQYRHDVETIFNETVRPNFPLLNLTIPNNGSLCFFCGIAVTNSIWEKCPLRRNDPGLANYGMPLVGVLPEGFVQSGAIIFDVYRCINIAAFQGNYYAVKHINGPDIEWGGVSAVCTHKRTFGITRENCISRPVYSATEIYLEYRRMDSTGEDFRIKAWPHGG